MNDDPLQTVSPDQVPVASQVAADTYVFVHRAGGPIQKMQYSSLLAKLIATDLVKASEAALQADLARDADTVALVENDPAPLKNGWWRKVGASGTGDWVQFEQLSKAVREACIALLGETQSAASDALEAEAGAGATLAQAQQLLIDTQNAAATLTGAPAVPPAPMSRTFGQTSADNMTVQGWYDIPAGALAVPAVGTDWFLCGWMAPGYGFSSAQYEVLLSFGNDAATNGSDRSLFLKETGQANGKLTIDAVIKNNGAFLMENKAPAPNASVPFDYGVPIFWMLAQVGDRAYFAWDHVENERPAALRSFAADPNHGISQFYGSGGTNVAGTAAVRAANVVTITRSNHGLAVGRPVWLAATGELTLVASVPNANTFTVASPGPDGALSGFGYRLQSMAATSDLFRRYGATTAAAPGGDNRGFGGRLGGMHMVRGTPNAPGSLASLISNGAINPAMFRAMADGFIWPTSIANAVELYGFRDPEAAVKDADGNTTLGSITGERSILGGLTKAGVSYAADPVAQPAYLRPDARPRMPHSFAFDPKADTGSIRRVLGTSLPIKHVKATLYRDAALAVPVRTVALAGTFEPADNGTCMTEIARVAADMGYYVKYESAENPNLYCITGPQSVGPLIAGRSQSTMNSWGSTFTGNVFAPADPSLGQGMVINTAHVIDGSDQAVFQRTRFRTIRAAGETGDGWAAILRKFIELRAADPARAGRKAAVAWTLIGLSGHSKEAFIYDRRRWKTSIGNLVPGVQAAGTWTPSATGLWSSTTPRLIKAGTARLFVGGNLVATSDAAGNWIGQGIFGSLNQSTGAYTVTAAFSGPAEIEAEMEFRFASASMVERPSNGISTFGDERDPGVTGNIVEQIRAIGRCGCEVSVVIDSWLNFLAAYLPDLSPADRATYMADVNDRFDARLRGVEVYTGKTYAYRPLARTPVIYMADPRTQSFSDTAEQISRNYQRRYAKAKGVAYLPGPVTYETDLIGSPHAGGGPEGVIYGGEVLGHGVAWWMGTAGAIGEEVTLAGVRRIDANTVELTVGGSIESYTAALATGAGGAAQGLFFSPADTAGLSRLDPAVYVPVIAGRKITVTKADGIAAGFWNINLGSVVPSSVTPLSAQTAILNDTLTLNQGGYTSAYRKGNGIQPRDGNLYCA